MNAAEIAAKLNVGPLTEAVDPFITVPADGWRAAMRIARTKEGLDFDFLQDLTATDHPKEGVIKVVVHLYSYLHGHLIVLKTEVDRMKPVLASLVPIWRGAEWFEREVFDLFGVTFLEHPDLRRVLLPPDWVGHPLRKDYSEYGGYREISNQRDNPLDGYLELDRRVKARLAELTAPPAAEPKEGA